LLAELVVAAPQPVALDSLAERLGVAPGTVARDVGTLRRYGVPIRTAPGRRYALGRASTAQPRPFGVADLADLADVVAVGEGGDGGDAADGADGADGADVADLDAADGARVLLFRQRDEVVDREVRRAVERAVRERRVAVLDYVDRDGATSVREVEPAGLLRGLEAWYLVGWCRLRGAGRAFRLDRICSARLTGERVTPHGIRDVVADVPAGFG
jgi:predicted DNA-binding transcriptional regulator YafY